MSDLRAHRVVLLSSPVADSLTSVLDERQERDGEGSQVGDQAEEARDLGGQQHEKADREQRIDVEARGDGRAGAPPGGRRENPPPPSRSKRPDAFPSSTATVRTKKSVRIRVSMSRGTSEGRTRPMAMAARASVADAVMRSRSKRRVRTTG